MIPSRRRWVIYQGFGVAGRAKQPSKLLNNSINTLFSCILILQGSCYSSELNCRGINKGWMFRLTICLKNGPFLRKFCKITPTIRFSELVSINMMQTYRRLYFSVAEPHIPFLVIYQLQQGYPRFSKTRLGTILGNIRRTPIFAFLTP